MPDVHMRLVLYKRIAGAPPSADLDDLQAEIIDRFGALPEPATEPVPHRAPARGRGPPRHRADRRRPGRRVRRVRRRHAGGPGLADSACAEERPRTPVRRPEQAQVQRRIPRAGGPLPGGAAAAGRTGPVRARAPGRGWPDTDRRGRPADRCRRQPPSHPGEQAGSRDPVPPAGCTGSVRRPARMR